MAKPTVGQQVLFTPYREASDPTLPECAATIAFVNDDGTVNLGYFDWSGLARTAQRVPLSPIALDGGYYVLWDATPTPAAEPVPEVPPQEPAPPADPAPEAPAAETHTD